MGFLSIDNGNKIVSVTQRKLRPLNCVVPIWGLINTINKINVRKWFHPQAYFWQPSNFFFLVSLSQSVTYQISWRKKKLWKERTLIKDFNLFSCCHVLPGTSFEFPCKYLLKVVIKVVFLISAWNLNLRPLNF